MEEFVCKMSKQKEFLNGAALLSMYGAYPYAYAFILAIAKSIFSNATNSTFSHMFTLYRYRSPYRI